MSITVSARKRIANRRNARQSTGPRTSEGKSVSSRNATVSGIYCAGHVLLPGESQSEFLLHRESLVRDYKPQDSIELMLVEQIVTAQWKIIRIHKLEQERHMDHLFKLQYKAANELRRLEDVLTEDDEKVDFSQWYQKFSQGTDIDPDEERDLREQMREREKADLQAEARSLIRMMKRAENQHLSTSCVQADQFCNEREFAQHEKFSNQENRLTNSIHRAMRELDRLRKSRERNKDNEDEEEPFEPYRGNHNLMLEQSIEETRTRIKAMKEEEQSSNMKNEPTEEKSVASDDAERDSNNQSCATMDENPSQKAHGSAVGPMEGNIDRS
jgi:hypothetical protein